MPSRFATFFLTTSLRTLSPTYFEEDGADYIKVKPGIISPQSHAATHGTAGSDPVTLAQSQVTNLTTDLAAKIPKTAFTAINQYLYSTASGVYTTGTILTEWRDFLATTKAKWDETNGRLGVGGGTPAYPLDVYKTTGVAQARVRTDDLTSYAQQLIQAGTSAIALAAFGQTFAGAGIYTPGSVAFQSATTAGLLVVNESGPVDFYAYGITAANKVLALNNANVLASKPLKITGSSANTYLGDGGAANLLGGAYYSAGWKRDSASVAPILQAFHHLGVTTGDIGWYNAATGAVGSAITWVNRMNLTSAGTLQLPSGRIGVQVATPTALVHCAAGTAAASSAPLKLTAGTNLTTPENGAFEYDGTNLYFTVGGVRKTVTLV